MYSWAIVGACMQTHIHIQKKSSFLSHPPLFSLSMFSTISVYLSVCLFGDLCIRKHFFGMCEWSFPHENYKCTGPCYTVCHMLLHICNMSKGNTHSTATGNPCLMMLHVTLYHYNSHSIWYLASHKTEQVFYDAYSTVKLVSAEA
jgi:hypothetical protein